MNYTARALALALADLGLSEIPGQVHERRIVEMHRYTTLEAPNDETAWCSAAVNYWQARARGMSASEWLAAGIPGTGKANARSWLDFGRHVGEPVPGAVAVLWRVRRTSWQGHVALVAPTPLDGLGNLLLVGGNQGNRVSIKPYPLERLLSLRL